MMTGVTGGFPAGKAAVGSRVCRCVAACGRALILTHDNLPSGAATAMAEAVCTLLAGRKMMHMILRLYLYNLKVTETEDS